ncbi:MAG: TetR/AcrR family transcriptional regulator [Betaproteobacteria bacterium]|nr:TetR/AcrR family transcriptional regulator [Betaproteobacteria bacterium]
MKQESRPSPQLDRDAWIQAAFDSLADHGVDGLRVEVLAKRCGVTKGSFYWHFRNRQDLLSAVLENWKDGRIRDILKQTRAEPGEELSCIRHVIEVYSASRNRKGMLIELAVRDWARRDATAAQIVRKVDSIRLDCAGRLFRACGIAPEEARSRSLLLYAYVFGISLMSVERNDPLMAGQRQTISDLIAGAKVS